MSDVSQYSPVCRDACGMPVIAGEWYWAFKGETILGTGKFNKNHEFVLCSLLVPTNGLNFYPAMLPLKIRED